MHDVVNKSSDDEYRYFGKIGIIHVISTFALSNTRVFMTFFSNQVYITLIKHFDEKHEYQERLNLRTT